MRNIRTVAILAAIPALVVASAVIVNVLRTHIVRTEPDSWFYNAEQNDRFYFDEQNTVDKNRVFRVSQAAWPKAEKWLQSRPIVALSALQAQTFTGTAIRLPAGTSPYLLRAVYYYEGTGRFLVGQRNDWLYVYHGCLGHARPPMQRAALVVLLKKQPKHVSVTCGMAE